MLGNMSDVDALAKGMAVALITTLYGSLLANVVCLPMASKLKARHDEEFLCKQLVMEGVIAIQEGENPRYIEEKLYKLLPAHMKRVNEEEEGVQEEGRKPGRFGRKKKNNQDKTTPAAVYEEGESMSAIKAVPSLGIDPTTGQELFMKKDGTLSSDFSNSP